MKTALIVVDYQSMEQTFSYLEECSRQITDWQAVYPVIVDNAPQLTGEELFFRHAEQIERLDAPKEAQLVLQGVLYGQPALFVKNKENAGYAGGNNLGVDIADRIFLPDFYLFSNNDIRLQDKFEVSRLLQVFEQHPEAAAVGPGIVGLTGERQNPRRHLKPFTALVGGYWNMLLPQGLQSQGVSNLSPISSAGFCDWVSGSFFLADAAKFKEVGGFDTATFLFMEEVILSRRFAKKNYRVYYDDSQEIVHAHGQTVKSTIGIRRSLRSRFASELYYYQTYEKLPAAVGMLAKGSFAVFMVLFAVKKMLAGLIRKEAV